MYGNSNSAMIAALISFRSTCHFIEPVARLLASQTVRRMHRLSALSGDGIDVLLRVTVPFAVPVGLLFSSIVVDIVESRNRLMT